jgi:hypothetical protein
MPIDANVLQIIAEYTARWTMLPWILDIKPKMDMVYSRCNQEELKMQMLSANPNAKDELEGKTLDSRMLSRNNADWALDILEADQSLIYWHEFSMNTNPRAIKILKQNMDKISMTVLSYNPTAIDLLESIPEKIDRNCIVYNSSPRTPALLAKLKIQMPSGYQLGCISAQWAIDLMEEEGVCNVKKYFLAMNTHPKAIKWMEDVVANDTAEINWPSLCMNPCALHILQKNPDKIYFDIFRNPAIFEPIVPAGLIEVLRECL